MHWVILGLTIWIGFPFFAINNFETDTANKLIFNYCWIPILIIALISTLYLYVNYLKKYNKPTNSKLKRRLQDILSVFFVTWFNAMILYGVTLSAIITTNALLPSKGTIIIEEPVIEYVLSNSRGVVRHYVYFKNPLDGKPIKFQVRREYKPGEIFSKKLYIGRWNQLYSFEAKPN